MLFSLLSSRECLLRTLTSLSSSASSSANLLLLTATTGVTLGAGTPSLSETSQSSPDDMLADGRFVCVYLYIEQEQKENWT